MKNGSITTGYSKNDLPYMRIKGGPQNLVIFEGLNFNHKPPSGMTLRWTRHTYKPFISHYTIYSIGRKPGLPEGYSIQNMSDDYATMIKNEMKTPVNLIGMSTGGPIAITDFESQLSALCPDLRTSCRSRVDRPPARDKDRLVDEPS